MSTKLFAALLTVLLTVGTVPAQLNPVEVLPTNTSPEVANASALVTEQETLLPVVNIAEPVRITAQQAEEIALQKAELTREQVQFSRTERDTENGVPEWEVEFRHGDWEYDFDIHEVTGAVLSWNKEFDPVKTEPPVTTQSVAPEKEVDPKAVALAHANLTADQVTWVKVEKDLDDGVWVYDVEFVSGDWEYDYEIHAATGAVREWNKEYEPKKVVVNESAKPEKEVDPKAIAYAHAGVTAEEATRVEVEKDRDDGVWVYEVQFRVGRWEYDYEIDATTGKILDWEKEIDD